MKTIAKCLLILFSVIVLGGCSCEKQMLNLSKKCPGLFETKHVPDTFFISEFTFDTVHIFSPGKTDTILLEKDRVEVKLVRNFDTLKTFIHLPADTIIKDIPVEVPIPVVVEKPKKSNQIIIIILCGIIFLLIYKPKKT